MKRQFDNKPNIVLVGFMGTGKTSISKRLSSQLEMRYVDTDSVIETDNQRGISDIFEKDGESVFRELESEAVNKVSKLYNYIISTGGGVVLREENVLKLKASGIVFCLSATPEEIYQRVGHQTHRPLLQTPDPLATIQTMLEDRAPYYAKADHTIETTDRSYEDIIKDIKRIYNNTLRTLNKKWKLK